MQKPFGALFPAEDVPAMVDYLSKRYGAERPSRASGRRVRAEDRTLARIDFSVTTTENGRNANAGQEALMCPAADAEGTLARAVAQQKELEPALPRFESAVATRLG